MIRYRALIIIAGLLIGNTMQAMVYDNRYFPHFSIPYVTVPGCNSFVTTNIFITTASALFEKEDKEIGISELWGPYDQAKVAYAIECTGRPNLLLPNWRNYEIKWYMSGKLQSQGFSVSLHKSFADHFFVGLDTCIMRVNARTLFSFDEGSAPSINQAGNKMELDDIRRAMNDQLGLQAGYISQSGFGDFDIYVGAYNHWDYVCKFRRIYTDIRLGLLVPSGVKQDFCKLGSVPFGGDGHWGIYVSNWTECEVKEDWKAGFLLRISRRFEKIRTMRMPVKEEPLLFGATIGDVKIDPAPTLVFAPYFAMENIRDGFGLRVVYTLRHHGKDYWRDARKNADSIPVDLTVANKKTSWNSDYVTLEAFYDFGKTKIDRGFEPVLYAAWDVPAAMLATKRVAKTHRISLGIQCTF